MAGLPGRRAMVSCSQNGGDLVPMELPSPGLKSQPLSIPAKLWLKDAEYLPEQREHPQIL